MVASPAHATLVANTVTTITLDDYSDIEVLNVDGASAIYFTTNGTTPTVEGSGCHVLPAAIGAITLRVTTPGPVTVKLISAGTPKASARGIPR